MKEKNEYYPFFKWLTDKSVALSLIAVLSPVFFMVILFMFLDMLFSSADRGLIFYRERRISRGKEFDILKFRVLRQDIINQMPPEDKHSRIYERDSSNLTWAGRFILKKWYLDELPQLFNILKGDMSLVGPRPWPVSLAKEQISKGIDYRNHILAGWTGLAQLQKRKSRRYVRISRSSEELDKEYMNYCKSLPGWRLLFLDLKIIWQTIWIMLESQGLKN